MFCTNCGAKLPDNAKFCPNCGTVIGNHQDPLPEAVQAAAEQTAAAAEAVTETVSEAVAAVPETAEEKAGQALETARAMTSDVAAATQVTVDTVKDAIQEAVPEAAEILSSQDDIPELVPEMIVEIPAEPVAEEPVKAPETQHTQTQESGQYTQYVQPQQPEPAAPQPPVQTYVPGPTQPVSAPEKKTGKKNKGLIAALLAVLVLAGAFLVYWNLPGTKFGRYVKQAGEAMQSEDYAKAAALYHQALDIRPDDQASIDALKEMYEAVQMQAVTEVNEARFEEAISHVRLMEAILPEETENNEYAMYDVYSTWISAEAEAGNFDTVQTLLARAESDLSEDYTEEVNTLAVNIRERMTLAETLRSSAANVKNYNSNGDFKGVYSELLNDLEYLKRYLELEGDLPFAVSENGDSGVVFYYDPVRDAAQVYVGGLIDGRVESGYADTYYVSNVSSASRSYEYFSADAWYAGRPGGNFKEINFKSEPDTPSESNCDIVTGTLSDGKYNGDIANNRNGRTYYMKFDNGKVQVLDTVDPNGDTGYVVGYTSDKNYWITFKESGLNGSYGVRYLT